MHRAKSWSWLFLSCLLQITHHLCWFTFIFCGRYSSWKVAFFCLLTIGSLSWWHDTPCCTEYFINKSSTKSILNFRWWIVHPTFCVWKTIDFKPWLSVVFQTMSCTIYPFFFSPLATLATADPFQHHSWSHLFNVLLPICTVWSWDGSTNHMFDASTLQNSYTIF